MTVNEMLNKLQQLSADGLGEFQMQFVHMKDDATQIFGFENEYFNLEDVSDIGYSDKLILFDVEKI